MHLPMVVFPQLGHGNVVSVFLTRRVPHEEQIFSWPDIKLFDLFRGLSINYLYITLVGTWSRAGAPLSA
jgi:hypothetical protein